jgi:hypothetical protein
MNDLVQIPDIVRVVVPGPPGPQGPPGTPGFLANLGLADSTSYVQNALDEFSARTLTLDSGIWNLGALFIGSNIWLRGSGPGVTILRELATLTSSASLISNKTTAIADSIRYDSNIKVSDLTIDGSLRSWSKWLTKLDGTVISDPAADYVMGSGALASGISGVVLTATVVGGIITAIAVNNGGTGWQAHGTTPYTATTVPLLITDSTGVGAIATATISGGTLVSATVTSGGINYSASPSVVPLGGYADIALLAQASVNRRNPNYLQTGTAISFTKVDHSVVENIEFIDHGNMCVADIGCRDFQIIRNRFIRCGKDDGAFMPVWVQSSGNPLSPTASYQDSESSVVAYNSFYDCRRGAVLFAPTMGGECIGNKINTTKEFGIFVPPNAARNGGRCIVWGNSVQHVRISDIVAHGIETQIATGRLVVGDNYIFDCDQEAIAMAGASDVRVEGNHLKNCGGYGAYPFGPFSERFSFAPGVAPIAGTQFAKPAITIGYAAGVASRRNSISGNTFEEIRSIYPPSYIQQVKSGVVPSPAVQSQIIEDNLVSIPIAMKFYDATLSGIFDTPADLVRRDNFGVSPFLRREDGTGNLLVEHVSGTGFQVLSDPTTPTPATADDSTRLATTAFVKAQGYAVPPSGYTGTIFAGGVQFTIVNGIITNVA